MIQDRVECKHCGNRIYPDWRHHGSNMKPCYGGLDSEAEPWDSSSISTEQTFEDRLPHRVRIAVDRITAQLGIDTAKDILYVTNELMDVWEHHSLTPQPDSSSIPDHIVDAHEMVDSSSISSKTLCGRSKDQWLDHIETLFEVANEGEDIPYNALLAWTGKPTKEDIAWAKKQVGERTE